jgi:hypothetical protein
MPTQTNYQLYPEVELDARLRFFDGQFLKTQDFVDVERYQIDRLRRHLRFLHVAGICAGFEVSARSPLVVAITAGTAVDAAGRPIVLVAPALFEIPPTLERPASHRLVVRYGERPDASQGGREGEPGARGFTRFREEPAFALVPGDAPLPADAVGLATLAVAADGVVTVSTPPQVRRYSGLRLAGPANGGPTLTTGGDAAPRRLDLTGDLRVTGVAAVQGGVLKVGAGEPRPSTSVCVHQPSAPDRWVGRVASGGDVAAVVLGEFNGQAWVGGHSAALDAWTDLAINPDNGRVGVRTRKPLQELHVGGRLALDHGVIQRGGDAITQTSELGLYSQVDGAGVRFVSRNGRHVFFNDGGIGGTADLTVERTGEVTARTQLRAPRLAADDRVVVGQATAQAHGLVTISADNGNWLFLRQVRALEGGGGFLLHNPWGQPNTPGGGAERNRLELAYVPPDGGPTRWGQLVVHGPSGRVGINVSSPLQTLHVAGRMALDQGVIQCGGEPITTATELGLYSQLDGKAIRMVTRGGRHEFYGDGGAGTTPDMTLDPTGLLVVRRHLRVPGIEWGSNDQRTESRDNAGLRGDAGARSGSFETPTPAPAANWPTGATSWWHLLDVRHSNPGNNFALQLAGSFYDQRLWFRKTNDNPATPWRRVLTTDDLGVTLDGRVGIGVGLLGTGAAPRAHLDIAQAPRSGAHPNAVKGLYVTGEFGAASDGVEIRHSNATQGVGIGYAGLYATGSNPVQHLSLMPRGAGGVAIGAFDPGGKLDVRVDGVGGWDRLVVTTSNQWNGANHVTIGTGPGAAGIMFHNPHVLWIPGENRASIRYAHTNAEPSRTWWDVGARADGAWSAQVNGGFEALRVEPDGDVAVGSTLRTPAIEWGSQYQRVESRDNAGLRGDAGARSGFFETAAPSPAAHWPPGASSWWHLLDVRHSNPGNNFSMQLAGSFYDQQLWFRKLNNDPATPWRRVITTDDLGGRATRPLQEQLVHRRPLFGVAGDAPVNFNASTPGTVVRPLIYAPFSYAVPPIQPGATRKYRVYAIYSDSQTTNGDVDIIIELEGGAGTYTFRVPRTWGHPNYQRDAYSDFIVGQPAGAHAKIMVRTTYNGDGRLYYLELQAFDVY